MQNEALKSRLLRHRQLAPTASVRVSPLCLGAMNFGEALKEKMGECNKDTAFQIMDEFVSNGGNFIDTANNYQNEESETWVGEWLVARGNRDDIVLATKYTSSYKNHEKAKIQSNYGGNGAKSMRVSLERSLKKLQTSYIDLFYVHWWDYTTGIPELMHNLNDLVASGKVIYLGISDSPAWVVAKANQYARDHGLRQFSVYQGLWNASIRDFEREILPMARDEGMGLIPWGALGQGRLRSEEGFKERERENPGRQNKVTAHDKAVSKVLERVGSELHTDVISVALAYLLHKVPYVVPIIGGRKVEHLRSNIKALGVALTDKHMEEIEKAYDFDPGFPHTFLSGSLLFGPRPTMAQNPGDIWLTKLMGSFDWVSPQKPNPPAQHEKFDLSE